MDKYIVKVRHANNYISIITLKAKNNSDLELKIAKELNNMIGTLDNIKSIEYEKVEKYTFKKKDYHWFVGTTVVSSALLKELLKDKGK